MKYFVKSKTKIKSGLSINGASMNDRIVTNPQYPEWTEVSQFLYKALLNVERYTI